MDNENKSEVFLPVSLLDLPDVITIPAEQSAYLHGFMAGLYTIFASIQDDGRRIAQDADTTGKVPHPLTFITLTLEQIKRYMLDTTALKEAHNATGTDGLRSMLKLLSTPSLTGQDGKKIIQ